MIFKIQVLVYYKSQIFYVFNFLNYFIVKFKSYFTVPVCFLYYLLADPPKFFPP